ncbi:hypothetical protein FVEG_13341 [Fusarium verticillioides 7600]|uniref:F-box domain-containing protein n=1 Tax=Gibberella moniliformis (strain M3125 / FGSC 7600) TaxID=334819 RepID=W7MVN3_GIBM7|nr:hypothetical protein FVEG_13341 [Fusarium verticillioides 7600]EWG55326.1 hypothetical protein FVEG_13341 [Fusarium verticillioides 7600]
MAIRNPNAALDRMPAELLRITAEGMDHQTLETVTLVCKKLREIFLHKLSIRIAFPGNVSQITSRLTLLLEENPRSPTGPFYEFVKHVYFDLQTSQRIKPSSEVARLMGDLCCKAVNLKKVTVSRYEIYKVLETQAPQLNRLAIMGFRGMPVYEMNHRMTTRILDDIRENFPQLEHLILGEFLNPKFSWGQHRFVTPSDATDLRAMISKAIMNLKSMPKLTHFAFVLSADTIGYGLNADWARDAFPNRKKEWYMEFVTKILQVLPRLQQLCVRVEPSVYTRGIRTPGNASTAVTWVTDQVEAADEFDNFFV